MKKTKNYKGFYKPYFKCLDCGKMTRIMEDNCLHCDSPIHITQEEYHEEREEKLYQTRLSKIKKYTEDEAVFNCTILKEAMPDKFKYYKGRVYSKKR